ncbi:hypothetical protein MASR2M29_08410 [Spirochaetota bacterium]
MNKKSVLLTSLMLPSGLLLWYLARNTEVLAASLMASMPVVMLLFVNIFIEESMRLLFALVFALAIKKLALPAKSGLWAVMAAASFAAMENISYLLAFPDAKLFLRILYSVPIHTNAAALYALSIAWTPKSAKALKRPVLAAFALACFWHYLFNIGAWYLPFKLVILPGFVLNTAATLALLLLLELIFVSGGYLYGRL